MQNISSLSRWAQLLKIIRHAAAISAITALSLCVLPAAARPDEPAPVENKAKLFQPAKPSIVGNEAPQFGDLAKHTAKSTVYLLAAFIVAASLYKKFKGGSGTIGPESISVIAKKGIGQRSSLLLVSVEGKKFFLAQSGDEVKLLAPISSGADLLDLDDDALAEELPPLAVNS